MVCFCSVIVNPIVRVAESICTHYSKLSGQPDIFLGSGTLKKLGTLLFAKSRVQKNRVNVIQKEKRSGCLFSFWITMTLFFGFEKSRVPNFFQGHKPTLVFKTRIVGAVWLGEYVIISCRGDKVPILISITSHLIRLQSSKILWWGKICDNFICREIKLQCLNVSTTPITEMGCQQCLHLSVVQLKCKHCRKPHCCNGVVGTFRQYH